MAPKFVAPYRLGGKRGKNDAADAAAICEPVQRPNMRFVPVKSAERQGRLMVHRARQGFVEQRTATLNRIRDLLSEVGIVLPLTADSWASCAQFEQNLGMRCGHSQQHLGSTGWFTAPLLPVLQRARGHAKQASEILL